MKDVYTKLIMMVYFYLNFYFHFVSKYVFRIPISEADALSPDLSCHGTIIRTGINLKFGEKFLTSQTKVLLKTKANIYSTIKDNLLLHCLEFSAFVVVFII